MRIGLSEFGIKRGIESFYSMSKKQLIVMTRYPVNFITSFLMIFIIILMFTIATLMFVGGGSEGGFSKGNYGGIMMYGFVLFMFLSDTLWTIGYNIRWEQYQGTLESLYLTPSSKFASLVSRVTVSVVWTGLNVIAAIIFVTYFLGKLPYENFGFGILILVLSLSGTFGMGFAFAAFTLIVKESANLAANMLQFVFLVLCAMFFPFSALPDFVVKYVSRLIPLSYCVDLFRSNFMGYPPGFPELLPKEQEFLIVLTFGILSPILGFWLYRVAENKVRRDGSLGEY